MYNHGERSNELFSVRSASLPNIFDYTRSCFCSLSVTRARFFPPYLAYVSTITSNRCVLKKSAVILLEISKLIPLDQSDREKEREREIWKSKSETEYLVANYFDPIGKDNSASYTIICTAIIRLWIISIVKWIQLSVLVFKEDVW